MTKIKIAIKNRWTGEILFEYEKENNTIKDTVLKAIEDRADLTDADLTDADLTDADLTRADLTDANLTRANLTDAKGSLKTSRATIATVVASWKIRRPDRTVVSTGTR